MEVDCSSETSLPIYGVKLNHMVYTETFVFRNLRWRFMSLYNDGDYIGM
jgi:hypothetical protein